VRPKHTVLPWVEGQYDYDISAEDPDPHAGRRAAAIAPYGAKRWGKKAAYRSVGRKPKLREFHGPYGGATSFEVPAKVLKARRPIGDHAKELLQHYYQRRAFWELVREGVPVGFAGETHLGVGPRRSEQLVAVLEEAGGPWPWFAGKALAAINAGRVARGRATTACPVADLFFRLLAGDGETPTGVLLEDIRTRAFGDTRVGTIGGPYERINEAEAEAFEYFTLRCVGDGPKGRGR
jgi:hypothetical protein